MPYTEPKTEITLFRTKFQFDITGENVIFMKRKLNPGESNEKLYNFVKAISTGVTEFKNCTFYKYNNVIQINSGWTDAINDSNYCAINNQRTPDGIAGHEVDFYYTFYFILKCEYVSQGCVRLYLKPDYLFTEQHDWSFNTCFIERMSDPFDELFKNTVPEGLECGNYVEQSFHFMDAGRGYAAVYTKPIDASLVPPIVGYGVPSALAITTGEVSEILTYIRTLVANGQEDYIVTAFMCPKICILAEEKTDIGYYDESVILTQPRESEGYVFKNNKLMCSPYTQIVIVSPQGEQLTLKPELNTAKNGTHQFILSATFRPTPTIYFIPANYQGAGINGENRTLMLSSQVNLEIPFAGDSFKSWWAQNAVLVKAGAANYQESLENWASQLNKDTAEQFINTGIGYLNPMTWLNPLGGLTSQAQQTVSRTFDIDRQYNQQRVATDNYVRSTMAQIKAQQAIPPSLHGNINGAGAAYAFYNALGYRVSFYVPSKEFAKNIDMFFTVYGYAQNKFKKPAWDCRERFTYIKTKKCSIGYLDVQNYYPERPSSKPEDREQKNVDSNVANIICNAFDSGVRVWNGDYILEHFDSLENGGFLNFELDNKIVTGSIKREEWY